MYLKISKLLLISICFLASTNMLKAKEKHKIKNYDEILKKVSKHINSIDTKTLLSMLKKNPNLKVIDVRSKEDVLKQGGYIKTNKLYFMPRGKIEFLIGDKVINIKPNERFVVYCYDGKQSLLAAKTLKDMGYKNVIHYKDSYKIWSKKGLKTSSLDRNLDSPLYSDVKEIADNVYVAIGVTAPYRYESNGHNNNLGFIVGSKYVLVWNAGSSYMLAKALHEEIKKITSKPVKYVLLENSQGHAILGSNYWREQGAIIIAQEIAKKEIKEKGQKIQARMERALKDKFIGTRVVMPDKFFKDEMKFDLGGKIVIAKYFGYAHEHSDIALWLPKEKILFGGDLAFNGRLLPIFKLTETDKWLIAWEKIEKLKAKIVVPGHGNVTDMNTVRKYTKDYLVYMRGEVQKILDNDGGQEDAYLINQDAYAHLDLFKELAKLNAALLFEKMEFE